MIATLPPALVLTAGLGTRLSPLTDVRAKPAVPVAGRPLVVRVLEWLAEQGVTDVVLNLHHLPETITREVGHGDASRLRVRYSWEPVLLGTAGGPRLALPLLGPRFFIINGDTMTDLSLRELVERHEQMQAHVTLAVIPHPEPERYGGVEIDDTGRVRQFCRAGVASARHFVGVQLAEAATFADVPSGTPAATVGSLYDRLIAEHAGAIGAFTVDAPFRDIGTPSDYLATTLAVAADEGLPSPGVGTDASIHPSATLTRTAVWDRVVIGTGCRLKECIVTDDVVLPDGATLERQVCIAEKHLRAPRAGTRLGNAVLCPLEPAG